MSALRPVLLACCLLLACSKTAPAAPAPPVCLLDQFDKPFSLSDARGAVLVLLAADRESSEQSRTFGKQFILRYGDSIRVLGIADLRLVPFFLRAWARDNFRNERVRVLLDWTGTVFRAYGLAPHLPNIILIDRQGALRRVVSGPDAAGTACREIDQLLHEQHKKPTG